MYSLSINSYILSFILAISWEEYFAIFSYNSSHIGQTFGT